DPYRYCNEQREKEVIGAQKHHDAVLDMAKKSIVLLKNKAGLLPLKKEGMKIAVIGALAEDKTSPLGSWRIASDDGTAVSVLEGLEAYDGNKVTFSKGPELAIGNPQFVQEVVINNNDRSGLKQAVRAARGKDAVIMVLGEHGFQSGEARSRTEIGLPGLQQELLEAVYKVNQNIVLVLMNGRPLTINWADENVPAIVEAWQLGTQSGHAIAQVLYGDYNPSGKLPMTFPKSVGQIPIYYNYKNTGRPTNSQGNVFWSHYIDESNDPLYVFGHGLSYTTFKYENLQLSADNFSQGGSIEVSCTLTNSGKLTGKEVVQLYIRDLAGSVTRPVKELKGFEMVELKPGESRTVKFTIDSETIRFYTANEKWEAEPGKFKVFIGGSSDTALEGSFSFQ
ncbi:MAG: glycoside hydrolase family 3 C-terminal domain-containing protein, partial [Bacteroidota bacterium]